VLKVVDRRKRFGEVQSLDNAASIWVVRTHLVFFTHTRGLQQQRPHSRRA
jgi:hypothetical protein